MDFINNNLFNVIDIIIISIILISSIVATFRGFIKEFFSVISWILSIVIAFDFFEKSKSILSEYITQKIIIDIIAFGIPFIIVFLICNLLSTWLSTKFNTSDILFDKFFGFLFGAFRGILVIILLYIGFKYLIGENLPAFLIDAYSFQYLELIGEMLKEVLMDDYVITIKEQKI